MTFNIGRKVIAEVPFDKCRNFGFLLDFFLNVFTEFAEFSDKNIYHYSKRAQTCHPATSCVRDHDVITVPARHT